MSSAMPSIKSATVLFRRRKQGEEGDMKLKSNRKKKSRDEQKKRERI